MFCQPKNVYEHVVLATQTYSPMDFAAQITLSQGNMWGIMRLFIKIFEDQPEGKVSALHFRSPVFSPGRPPLVGVSSIPRPV